MLNMAEMAEDCGLCGRRLHARTREQGYSGSAVGHGSPTVKAAVKIPVIGNGDIRPRRRPARWSPQTGCDAVMIGRAASSESMDLPPDRAVHRNWPLR